MNFHECMKLFYPETTIILYNQKNEVVLEGQVKDIRKECEKYHNVEGPEDHFSGNQPEPLCYEDCPHVHPADAGDLCRRCEVCTR